MDFETLDGEVSVKLTVTKGEFANALGFDYDGFVKGFTKAA